MDLREAAVHAAVPATRHPWEVARIDAVRGLIARHVTLPIEATVVDVGSGDGFVVEELARTYPGVRLFAIDTAFTPEMLTQERAGTSIRALHSVDDIPPLEAPASLVLLMDVIEHVADDVALMTQLARAPFVSRETRFVITVPAFQSLFSSHDVFLGHHRRYSRGSLAAALDAAGLAVDEQGSFFTLLTPLRWLQVMKERVAGAGESVGLAEWQGGTVSTALFRRVLAFDASVSIGLGRAGVPVPGLSLYAVCRRR